MKRFNKYLLGAVLMVLVCLCSISCKKSTVEEQITTNSIVKFSVSGIRELLPQSSSSNAKGIISKPTYEHKEFNTFETLSYFDPSGNESSNLKNLRASTTMAPGVRYRVELFEVDGSVEKHWRTLNLQANSMVTLADTVGVVYGKRYRWYAYSYNTNENITIPEKSLNVSMGNNKDFLYATNEITINQKGNSEISIVFQRKTARLTIDVDTRGANANSITNLQVEFPTGIIKSGVFNIQNQTVSVTDVNSSLLTLSHASFEDEGGSYRKVAYLYSASPITRIGVNALSVEIPSIAFNVTNGLSGTTNSYSETLSDIPFNFSDVNVPIAASGSLKFDFLSRGIAFNGINWAPANLYMHDASSTHRYRFYPHNNQTTDYRTFFSFGGIEPIKYTGVGGVRNTVYDVCGMVFPKDRWRTPQAADFNGMISSGGLVTNVVNLLVELLSLGSVSQENTTAVHSPYPNARISYTPSDPVSLKSLSFPMNKYLPSIGLVGINETPIDPLLALNLFQLVPGDLSTVGSLSLFNTVHLWTADELIDLDLLGLNILDVGSQSYLGLIKAPAVISERRKAVVTSDLTNINALGAIKILKSNFKNIRCVRNSAWNPNAPGYDPNPVYSAGDTYLPQQLLDLGISL